MFIVKRDVLHGQVYSNMCIYSPFWKSLDDTNSPMMLMNMTIRGQSIGISLIVYSDFLLTIYCSLMNLQFVIMLFLHKSSMSIIWYLPLMRYSVSCCR
jgi:hypothetical protein